MFNRRLLAGSISRGNKFTYNLESDSMRARINIMLTRPLLLTSLLLIVVLLPLGHNIPVSITIANPTVGTLTMTKLLTNVTAIASCTVNIASASGAITPTPGTLYGNIRIVLNLTLTNTNTTYAIQLSNFYVIVTQKNMVVANVTNVNLNQNPTNIIRNILLFPDIPVILILSFKPTCVTTGQLARLLYLDGLFNFQYNLP